MKRMLLGTALVVFLLTGCSHPTPAACSAYWRSHDQLSAMPVNTNDQISAYNEQVKKANAALVKAKAAHCDVLVEP